MVSLLRFPGEQSLRRRLVSCFFVRMKPHWILQLTKMPLPPPPDTPQGHGAGRTAHTAPSTMVSRAFIQEGRACEVCVTGTVRGSLNSSLLQGSFFVRMKTSCWSHLTGPLVSCIRQAGGCVVKEQGPSDLFLSPIGERFVPQGQGVLKSPDFTVIQAQAWARPGALG